MQPQSQPDPQSLPPTIVPVPETGKSPEATLPSPAQSKAEEVKELVRKIEAETEIFPPGHALEPLVQPTFSGIRQALAEHDISFNWNSTKYDESRRGKRNSYDEVYGPGAELQMPISAAYVSCPGKNTVFLPHEIDRTIVSYMQDIGFLGKDVVFIKTLQEMRDQLAARGRKVYSIDDLPPSFDPQCVNSSRDMMIVNSKEYVKDLSSYAPHEIALDMGNVGQESLDQVKTLLATGRLYVKTCNTEAAGKGVFRVSDFGEFETLLANLNQARLQHPHLSEKLVVQPEIKGINKSFQVFMDPARPDQIPVIALTDQLIATDGVTYAGSVNHAVSAERLEKIGPAIVDMLNRVQAVCPGSMGFLMCDYFEQPDGKVVLFDPGLRPTGNTPGAMVRLWLEETTGKSLKVTNGVQFDFGEPGLEYAEVVRRLGRYADPVTMQMEGYGVLPWGHNHIQGKSSFIVITPSEKEFPAFMAELGTLLSKS